MLLEVATKVTFSVLHWLDPKSELALDHQSSEDSPATHFLESQGPELETEAVLCTQEVSGYKQVPQVLLSLGEWVGE